jgi:transcriptional regulator with XRE-family HTH domain
VLGNSREELGKLIRDRRKALGLSIHELADQSGLSYNAIQFIESGKSNPRTDTLEAIFGVLNITATDAFGKPTPSKALSPRAISGPLSATDGALILYQLAEVSPDRRAVVLGILFDDASLVPESLPGLLRLLSTIG